MNKLFKISNISFKMLLIASISYFVNYLSNGLIFSYLSLNPSLIINDFQIWRIITFPLAGTSVESYILFFITFTMISPNLEKSFKKPFYLLFISLLICLHGAISIILNYNTNINFFGSEGISFFVISLFVFINFKKKIQFSKLNPIKTPKFALSIIAFWLISVVAHSYLFNDSNILYISGFSGLFGIISALLIFGEMKIIEYVKNRNKKIVEPIIEIPRPEELAMAYSQPKFEKSRFNKFFNTHHSNDGLFDDEDFTEDHLNSILDKVNEQGLDSLSEYEVEYLKEYSQRIN